jgi:ribose-phosphate pyrophosphokinase
VTALVLGFAEGRAQARRLTDALGLEYGEIPVHRFPDEEALVRIPRAAPTVLLYRSLDHPDTKLIELILAASALRDGGARHIILVAPYLAYMRQDMAFRPGEAVSQRVMGELIATHFDALLTVDPHLHRTAALGQVVPAIPAIAISAAPALGGLVEHASNPVIIGPDEESRPWTESLAATLGLQWRVGTKIRVSDRRVSIAITDAASLAGRNAVIVDDVISSGKTVAEAARALRAAGVCRIDVLATHCLAGARDLTALATAGVASVQSSDSISGPTARLHLASLLAAAIHREGLLG